MKKFFSSMILLAILLAFVANCSLAAESGEEESHHSLLHFIFKLVPQGLIPEPGRWGQPDLILNTYLIVLFLIIFMVLATRKLQKMPVGRVQNLLEMVVESLTNFFGDILGERGRKYVPFVCSYFIFILCLNLLGIFPGFQAPTADLNTTLALGLTAVLGVQIIAIKENGPLGYLKHLAGEPIWLAPIMFPLHIIGEIARAMSLSIRLFGNIFGEETVTINLVIMGLVLLPIAGKAPWIPVQLPMVLFGIFTAFLQALVFSTLTSIYIATFLEQHEEGHHE